MRTLIITCGCLEPSKDGIGDYCFNLAKALNFLNVRVVLVSINDFFVKSFREEARQDVQICRIPAKINHQQKYRIFRSILQTVSPDHVSFQYVSYAYHSKGLPVITHKFLVEVLKSYEVSIMMHEPWIGRSKEDSFRHRLIGYFQQIIIKQLINGIAPIRVFTSNLAFSKLLRDRGIANTILPLFSNIPYCRNAMQLLPDLFERNGFTFSKNSLNIILFGRIPFSWKKKELIKWLEGKQVNLLFAGRSDQDTSENLIKEIRKLDGNFCFYEFGELAKEEISALLQFADVGLALTPPEILGKSGVVAAYKEHGLPIILAGNHESFTSIKNTEMHDKMHLDIPFSKQINKLKRKQHYTGVKLTAELFLNNIQEFEFQRASLI